MSKRQKLWPALALSTSPGEGLQSVWLPTFNQELLNILCGQVGKEPRFHWLSTHPCFPFSTLLMALHLSPDLLPQTSLRPNCFLLENTCSLGFTDVRNHLGFTDHENLPEASPGMLATLGRVFLYSGKTSPSSLVTLSWLKRIT